MMGREREKLSFETVNSAEQQSQQQNVFLRLPGHIFVLGFDLVTWICVLALVKTLSTG